MIGWAVILIAILVVVLFEDINISKGWMKTILLSVVITNLTIVLLNMC